MIHFKKNTFWFSVVVGLWLLFATAANAGIATVIKDFEVLKLLYYAGAAIVAAIVAIKVTKIKLLQHDDSIRKTNERVDGLDSDFKQRLYNKDGSPIYMTKTVCREEKFDDEKRQDKGHRALCEKINKLEEIVSKSNTSQSDLATAIGILTVRVDQYMNAEKENNLINKIDLLIKEMKKDKIGQ